MFSEKFYYFFQKKSFCWKILTYFSLTSSLCFLQQFLFLIKTFKWEQYSKEHFFLCIRSGINKMQCMGRSDENIELKKKKKKKKKKRKKERKKNSFFFLYIYC